ncbi:LacI family DNA-binding transcriptional regulator [Ornithinimicrobium avium]|uniref:LacI family transcriptional regulator n=1 Tax=Ornithinimicrobium avium TaxID=2283195 RepID=A0A345NK75_9MICO|nr:LacI family DNA-binding transcriptional regulator [Ornithinimicrobium avium]AXH95433.1 LacI family transcriptional regulator [Ornithinimicrobium avium]
MQGKQDGTLRRSPTVTLASLARELGVNVSTVSRALSERPTGVSAATVATVRRAAEQRGYRRNLAARTLRTGRSFTVGMTVARLTDVALASVYGGVDEASIHAGYTTFVANTLDRADLRRRRLDLMLGRQVDGFVLADSHLDGAAIGQLDDLRVPHVLALRGLPGRLSVTTDDLVGGRLVAEHLLGLGHRRIGVVAGDVLASTGEQRTRGFLDTLDEAGVDVPQHRVVPGLFDVRSGVESAAQILATDPDVTAIFATSDAAAIGVMATLRDLGRRIPEDVAVVGYNNLDLAEALPVPLTSVDSRLFDVGTQAMRTLLELIGGGSPGSLSLEPRLVVRASTVP